MGRGDGRGGSIAEGVAKLLECVFQLVFTIVAISLGLLSLAVPWRTIPAIKSICSSRREQRERAVTQFLFSVADCIAIPLGILALAVLWRLPYALMHYFAAAKDLGATEMQYRGDLRVAFMLQFFFSICDIAAFVFALVSFCCPWRIPFALWSYYGALNKDTGDDSDDSDDVSAHYNFSLRERCFMQGFLSIADWILFPVYAISIIRWPTIWKEWHWKNEDLRGFGNDRWLEEHYDPRNRVSVVKNCFRAFLDILFLPCIVLVSLSGWRTSILWDHMRVDALAPRHQKELQEPFEKGGSRLVALGHLLSLLVDLPFVFLFLVLTATLWRAAPTWSACSKILKRSKPQIVDKSEIGIEAGVVNGVEEEDAKDLKRTAAWKAVARARAKNEALAECRAEIFRQFQLLLRDVPILACFLLLLGTFYRFAGVFMKLVQSRKRLSREEPLIRLSSATVELPEAGSVVFEFKGKRQASRSTTASDKTSDNGSDGSGSKASATTPAAAVPAMDPSRTRMGLYIAGETFWGGVGAAYGDTVALLGRGALPLALMPTHLSPASLEESGLAAGAPDGEEDDDVVLRVDLTKLGVSRKTVLNALQKEDIAKSVFLLQLEYETADRVTGGASRGVLLRLLVRVTDMLPQDNSAGAPQVLPLPPITAEPADAPLDVLSAAATAALESGLAISAEESLVSHGAVTNFEDSQCNSGYPNLPTPDDVRYEVEPLADVLLPIVVPALAELLLDIAHVFVFALLALLSPCVRLPQCLVLLLTTDPKEKKQAKASDAGRTQGAPDAGGEKDAFLPLSRRQRRKALKAAETLAIAANQGRVRSRRAFQRDHSSALKNQAAAMLEAISVWNPTENSTAEMRKAASIVQRRVLERDLNTEWALASASEGYGEKLTLDSVQAGWPKMHRILEKNNRWTAVLDLYDSIIRASYEEKLLMTVHFRAALLSLTPHLVLRDDVLSASNIVAYAPHMGRYTGSVDSANKPHGVGSFTGSDFGAKVTYEGGFYHGLKQGYGVESTTIGSHEGIFHDNKAHGQAVMKYKNGCVYVGPYKHGLRHGVGIFSFSYGRGRGQDVYEGAFDRDMLDGPGTYYVSSGEAMVARFSSKFISKTKCPEPLSHEYFTDNHSCVIWSSDRLQAWRCIQSSAVDILTHPPKAAEISLDEAALLADQIGLPVPGAAPNTTAAAEKVREELLLSQTAHQEKNVVPTERREENDADVLGKRKTVLQDLRELSRDANQRAIKSAEKLTTINSAISTSLSASRLLPCRSKQPLRQRDLHTNVDVDGDATVASGSSKDDDIPLTMAVERLRLSLGTSYEKWSLGALCKRSTTEKRAILRECLVEALEDWAGWMMIASLLFTVYRFLPLRRALRRCASRMEARLVVRRQHAELIEDGKAAVMGAFVVVTLYWSIDFLGSVWSTLSMHVYRKRDIARGLPFDGRLSGRNDPPMRLKRESSSSSSPALHVDDRVEANYLGRGTYYEGRITRVHRDGTLDIKYDDGGGERALPKNVRRHPDTSPDSSSGSGFGGSGSDYRQRDTWLGLPTTRSAYEPIVDSRQEVINAALDNGFEDDDLSLMMQDLRHVCKDYFERQIMSIGQLCQVLCSFKVIRTGLITALFGFLLPIEIITKTVSRLPGRMPMPATTVATFIWLLLLGWPLFIVYQVAPTSSDDAIVSDSEQSAITAHIAGFLSLLLVVVFGTLFLSEYKPTFSRSKEFQIDTFMEPSGAVYLGSTPPEVEMIPLDESAAEDGSLPLKVDTVIAQSEQEVESHAEVTLKVDNVTMNSGLEVETLAEAALNATLEGNESHDVVRFQWTGANLKIIADILLEAFQLSSLCFLVTSMATASDDNNVDNDDENWRAGGAVFRALVRASRVVTLTFPGSGAFEDIFTVKVVFLITVGAVGLFYLVVAAPFVTQDIVKWREQHKMLQNDLMWRATVIFLSQECYVTICLKLMSPLLCNYESSQDDDDERTASLMGQEDVACWKNGGDQPILAAVGLCCLAFYAISAQALSLELQIDDGSNDGNGGTMNSRGTHKDIGGKGDKNSSLGKVLMSSEFFFAVMAVKLLLTLFSVLLVGHPVVFLSVAGATLLGLGVITVYFEKISSSNEAAFSVASVTRLQAAAYFAAAWSALVAAFGLIAARSSSEDREKAANTADYVAWAGWAFIALSWSVVALRHRQRAGSIEEHVAVLRRKCAQRTAAALLEAEKSLFERQLLLECSSEEKWRAPSTENKKTKHKKRDGKAVSWIEQNAFWSQRRRRAWRRQLLKVADGKRSVSLAIVARWLKELEALCSASAFFECTTMPPEANAGELGYDRVKSDPGMTFLWRRRAWLEALSIRSTKRFNRYTDIDPAVIDACTNALLAGLQNDTAISALHKSETSPPAGESQPLDVMKKAAKKHLDIEAFRSATLLLPTNDSPREPRSLAACFSKFGKKGFFQSVFAQDMRRWAFAPVSVYATNKYQFERIALALSNANDATLDRNAPTLSQAGGGEMPIPLLQRKESDL